MKIKATTPCYRFRNVSPEEQIEKIKEEVAEIEAAYAEYEEYETESDLKQLMMEIIDVQVCCSTFLHQLVKNCNLPHCNAHWVKRWAKRRVVEKNMRRGYYAGKYSAPEGVAKKKYRDDK